jgi:hyaluronoglucosaminidase
MFKLDLQQRGKRGAPLIRVLTVLVIAGLGTGAILLLRYFLAGPPEIVAGRNPDTLTMTASGRVLYVVGGGRYLTPVNPAMGKPGPPIRLRYRPQDVAVAPDGRVLYTSTYNGMVIPVDAATGEARAPVRAGSGPFGSQGLALAPDGRTLYIAGTGNAVLTMNTATGRLGKPIRVLSGPTSLLMAPGGRTLWVLSADLRKVVPVNLRTGRQGSPIRPGDIIYSMAITPDGRTLYIAGDRHEDSTVTPINTASGAVGKPIVIDNSPDTIVISPDGRTLYASIPNDGTVTEIDAATGRVIGQIRVAARLLSAYPTALALTPNGDTLFAINNDSVADIALHRN